MMENTAVLSEDASDGALEDSLVAYVEAHADTTPADLLRAFNVRCYLWPRLTSAERDAGTVVPDARIADCSQNELVACFARWIRLREAETAFRQALAAEERVVVVHGPISGNAMRALAALVPGSADEPAKRLCTEHPSMGVRALDARAARRHGRHLRQRGYCVLPSLVSCDLDAWIRRRHLPRELSFYPNWRSSDFFHNAPSEPPVPVSDELAPLRELLPGIEAVASSVVGEPLVCLQANATLYSAQTNAQLGDHRDGSPFSVVVHVSASRPETAGLIFNEELVRFAEPGTAVLLRGDEYTHRSVAVEKGEDRLVLVFFLDFASARRAAHPRPANAARAVAFFAPDVSMSAQSELGNWSLDAEGLADTLQRADLALVVGCAMPALTVPGQVAAFGASVVADFVFGEGPLERVLGHAVGTY